MHGLGVGHMPLKLLISGSQSPSSALGKAHGENGHAGSNWALTQPCIRQPFDS